MAVETLAMDVHVAARQFDETRAVDDLIAIMHLGDALASEPLLDSQLTRFDIYKTAFEAMAALPVGLSSENVRRMIAVLAKGDRREAFVQAISGEAVLHAEISDHPERLVEQREDWAEYIMFNDPMNIFYNTPLGAPFRNADAATYFETIARIEDVARQPYYQVWQELGMIQYEIHKLPATRMLSREALSSLSWKILAQPRHEARLDLAQLGLALEHHYASFGEYPESLDAVAGDLPEGVPLDVFSGKPYLYRPTADTLLLYSVGSNRSDDGGTTLVYPNEADIVWRVVSPE
jgi:hypothetical protein